MWTITGRGVFAAAAFQLLQLGVIEGCGKYLRIIKDPPLVCLSKERACGLETNVKLNITLEISEKRAKVGDALRGGISWRCSDAVNSQPRKGYAT